MALMIPIVAIALPMVVAIVGMLTKHQQRMAEIIHQNSATLDAIPRLEAQIQELRAMVMEHALAIDNLSNPSLRPREVPQVTDQARV